MCLRNAVEIINSRRVNDLKAEYHLLSEERWEILLQDSDRVWAKRFLSDLWMWGYLHGIVQCDLVASFCLKSDLMLLSLSQFWLRISTARDLFIRKQPHTNHQYSFLQDRRVNSCGSHRWYSSSLCQISQHPWTQIHIHAWALSVENICFIHFPEGKKKKEAGMCLSGVVSLVSSSSAWVLRSKSRFVLLLWDWCLWPYKFV